MAAHLAALASSEAERRDSLIVPLGVVFPEKGQLQKNAKKRLAFLGGNHALFSNGVW